MSSENDLLTVEEHFSYSWDGTEQFFSRLSSREEWWNWMNPILGLIAMLRSQGYDRQFRAGQSMYFFLLSRSRHHHLRPEQAFLVFELKPEGGMEVRYYENNDVSKFTCEQVAITPQVEAVLQKLLLQPID